VSTSDPNATLAALAGVTTATLTTLLLKQGLRNVWIRGALPLSAGAPRIVGRAFTLRFVPAREDLATPASWSSPTSTRAAIEAMPEGCVAVVDTHGTTDAGFWGDILCARMVMRGVAGLVSDGAVRDLAGVLETGLPVWRVARRRRPRSRASRSSTGSSPSAAAAWRCSRMT
jgi:regulator of RNase E activity RraA